MIKTTNCSNGIKCNDRNCNKFHPITDKLCFHNEKCNDIKIGKCQFFHNTSHDIKYTPHEFTCHHGNCCWYKDTFCGKQFKHTITEIEEKKLINCKEQIIKLCRDYILIKDKDKDNLLHDIFTLSNDDKINEINDLNDIRSLYKKLKKKNTINNKCFINFQNSETCINCNICPICTEHIDDKYLVKLSCACNTVYHKECFYNLLKHSKKNSNKFKCTTCRKFISTRVINKI
jgi:hypothetical protein